MFKLRSTFALGAALAAACAVLNVAPSASAATPAALADAANHPAQVSIPDTERFEFTSKSNGRRYAISVALPETPPPPGGYPVIYVLDGDGFFASFTEAVRLNAGAQSAIVVGIGYPHDAAFAADVIARHQPLPAQVATQPAPILAMLLQRNYDLTLPADDATFAQMHTMMGATKADIGGLDIFLHMIETEVKPRIYDLAPVNKDNQILFGHSLGGLAVVEALFTEPQAFHTFIASSPSIWWSNRAVLAKEAAFTDAVNAGKVAPRVLLGAGGEEETVPVLPPQFAAQAALVKASIESARMIGNACDLSKRLKALHGAKGYEVADCVVSSGMNHVEAPWPAIGRTIAFAFPQ